MELPEIFAATCCQVIRERRQQLGLSQEEVARRSGLARSYICDVERGARHPSLRNVSTLARALNIPTSTLISQVELHLAGKIDLQALKDKRADMNGLHSEIIRYYNERMSDGLIIADNEGFIFFNEAANQLTGLGQIDIAADEWSEKYGCFQPDRVTKCKTHELPLVRALNGEPVDNAQVYLKNPSVPEGRTLLVTARPLKTGESQAAVVIFHELSA